MERIDLDDLAQTILTAPGWARVGLTMPDEHMRTKAATELAHTIADRLSGTADLHDPDQLNLFS